MARSRLSVICLSIAAALIAIPLAIVERVERGVAFLFSLFPAFAAKPAFAFDGPAMALDSGGQSADPALLNSLRHEAGMRRLT